MTLPATDEPNSRESAEGNPVAAESVPTESDAAGDPGGAHDSPASSVRKQRRPNDTWSDRAAVAAAVIRWEGARATRALVQPLRLFGGWKRPSAERLLIAPQDIRTADGTVAADIYAGHLVFGGSFVDSHGHSPFEVEPPSDAWAEGLHGFGWLRHLRAANTGLSRANARALVEDWITQGGGRNAEIAWRPAVVARRLLSWLSQSPVILAPPDAIFYRRFMRSIGTQVAVLERALAGSLAGEARLLAAIALAEAGLCAEGLATARRQGSRLLAEELNRQILADGGHISRNPAVLVELLLDLLPLRQSYAARSAPVPPALLNAIDRIIPMIRMFRHGDGTLALFNGMGVTEPDVLATVLTYDDIRSRPLLNAPHTGYQRIEAEGTLVIGETGRAPPVPFGNHAHAGTLSFELSVGQHRVVVNCGRPTSRHQAAHQAARMTAAHSTLIIDDVSSSRFAPLRLRRWFGDGIIAGPRQVPVARTTEAGTQTVTASHDGYAAPFGLLHTRSLVLDQSGSVLRGDDSLSEVTPGAAGTPRPFAIRFHLHPSVRAQSVQGGTAVLLTLPNDERWLFEAAGMAATLEESIMFAAAHGTRPTTQIVVEGRFPDVRGSRWSVTRVAAGNA